MRAPSLGRSVRYRGLAYLTHFCTIAVLILATSCVRIEGQQEHTAELPRQPWPLPQHTVEHIVERQQTLQEIATLYGTTPKKIIDANRIRGEFIRAGQALLIPIEPPSSSNTEGIQVESVIRTLRFPCSTACFITQRYQEGHGGIDLQNRYGGAIFAAEDGIVIQAEEGWNEGYGNVIRIDHGGGLVTLYAHNRDLYVEEGDRVTRGHIIGFMGNSGNTHGVTGIHVHFEVLLHGKRIPPLRFFPS